MKKRLFALALFAVTCLLNIHAGRIGSWKAYMAYHDITEIEKGGNMLYVLASDNLYSYNTNDQSIQTYDKVNALSDCGIAHIAWCQGAKSLVILYANNNIDLMDNRGEVVNMSDYYNKSMTDDKTVNSIDVSGNNAYLSTGFGIVAINVAKAEILNTYNLGFKVDYSYIENNYIYAASSTNGLYRGTLTDNLLDKSNWNRVGDYTPRYKNIDPELLSIVQTLNPGGPKYNHFGFMRFVNNQLYTSGAGFSTYADFERPGCIQILKNDEWTTIDENITEKTGNPFVDVSAIDIDPNDATHFFAGGRTGLYEFKNNKFTKQYSFDNSPLKGASTVNPPIKSYVIVQGVKFDKTGNLWCLNSISPSTSILEYTSTGTWNSHHKNELMVYADRSFENMTSPIFDSRNLLWFVNDHYRTPALICYQPSTDAIKVYKTFINEDGTNVNPELIRCVAEDNDKNIWIGTNMGPLRLLANQIGTDNDIFDQIKVPRNDGTNLADYLLSGVDITCMAIDGAGRKWFGTNNVGAYLISEDNYTEVHHFTKENSDLLSNNIESIAINPKSGEVFFGTDMGLCSYMGDATEPSDEMTTDNVYAYPNPVRPDYTGLITVTGLTYNADVKIVTTNGVLVAAGRSNGGTFTWDGTDLKGKRVASGVYMVEAATEDGGSGTVCKIAIIR